MESTLKRAVATLALAAVALCLATAEPVSATDSEGRPLSLTAPAARVVSLSPGITETLFAIGAGSRVVGVTTYCDWPVAAKSRPKVGGFSASTISVEKIVALKPDFVIGSGNIHRSVEEALVRLGIPVFTYAPSGFEEIARDMKALGALTDSARGAEAAADSMLATIAKVRVALADLPASARPTVFWEIYDEPLMTCGAATFQHFILEAAGGRDIFADLPGSWPRVGAEDVIRRAPAWILGADDHGDKMSVAQIASRPGWSTIPAVRDGRVVLVPAAIVSRPGPRVAEGVLAVAMVLYPERFKK
ncbi:MAG TPA: cobalamin-binding protein [Rectinemataceae bacterium]|nr:cobalamin-binding protein [Rectinemataceae bacterium]